MKTRLFENVGGNKFKLLTENTNVNEQLVASGLKKVFMNAGDKISYNQIESVGMGYIKDIPTAKSVALQEARILAKEFGYKDSENDARFVKDSANTRPLKEDGEVNDFDRGAYENGAKSPVSSPGKPNAQEEQQEVQIGKQILAIIEEDLKFDLHPSHEAAVEKIKALAEQLIKMHGQQ